MNGIHVDFNKITNIDPKENIFELRQKIYDDLIQRIFDHIDFLYNKLANDQKIEEIKKRTIKSLLNKESLSILYKGIEIPIMNKGSIILDNIEYVPIYQLVDKSCHLQKDGRYIVIKNNVRNTFLKLDGHVANVLYKNAQIPLLPYFLYLYPSITDILIDFGYKIIPSDMQDKIDLSSGNYYIIPEYYENKFIIVERTFESGSWKEYFLSPFKVENFEFHQTICNNIIDTINNDIIPEIINENGEVENSLLMKDIKNTSAIDEELAEKKEIRENIDEKNTRDYILTSHKTDQELLNKIFTILNAYHVSTRSVKKSLTKVYLETSLFKYNCKDITMNNISIFSLIINNIKENKMIPLSYNIADISQKNIRFLEWYVAKLGSVASYPEQNIISEIAKTEQKRIYNNTVNPLAELAMMERVNIYGPGALPFESCSLCIRNLHQSYKGVISPEATPAGRNVGISLHIVPEVNTTDFNDAVSKFGDDNIVTRLYNLQDEK